eukprot:TRINITY_DN5728_c0_g1_i1.p1 TRINITY_DN5728_c0_g1~~TRINITY_DN5728_c0_g1_i1.p1  ORF type:complete len:150 (-),score=26.94 TRINITY_DN5728_c0_g1_i1:165-614(-)
METQEYPIYMKGKVIKGFGRGSKELGYPTANLEPSAFEHLSGHTLGVFYGLAQVDDQYPPHPMVMSIGWNPFYQNKEKSVEVHILKKYDTDFYGSIMKVMVVGFIRHMTSFNDLDSLIKAIEGDIQFANQKLSTQNKWYQHDFWTSSSL